VGPAGPQGPAGTVDYALTIRNGTATQTADFNITGNGTIGTNLSIAGNALVNGSLIRRVARVHGLGPQDGTDNGYVSGRTLNFTKTQAATGIRISYVDNLRTYFSGLGGVACQWELRIDGASCTSPGALSFHHHVGYDNNNFHTASSLFGTCFGVGVGAHTIRVHVSPMSGYPTADCYTGWNDQYWAIEAEEVF
jgi:hypothetical protein